MNLINLFIRLRWNYSVFRSLSISEAESMKEALSKEVFPVEQTVRFKLEHSMSPIKRKGGGSLCDA